MNSKECEMMSAMTAFYREHIGSNIVDIKVVENPKTVDFTTVFEDGLIRLTRCSDGYSYSLETKDASAFSCSSGGNFYTGKNTDVAKTFVEMTVNF